MDIRNFYYNLIRGLELAIAIFLGVLCTAVNTSLAQQSLTDPGWDDKFFADYLEAQGNAAASAAGGVNFSIPVLGYAGSDDAAGPPSTLGAKLTSVIPNWPACANGEPTVTTVPNSIEQAVGANAESPIGSWFFRTYDFDCMQIVISGDRHKSNRSDNAADDSPLSGEIKISRPRENDRELLDQEGHVLGDAAPGVELKTFPQIKYVRGNLTYTVEVACETAAANFCGDDTALTKAVEELEPVAGSPQP
ncbi:UNVERIFIED_ORG: hypothetical protein GGD44_000126 [Rhizobium esperanzae]|nr:hypothetical protein RHECNPAF_870015 [Rhizobium etli CNPAF512]